jgi:hypothetical protein
MVRRSSKRHLVSVAVIALVLGIGGTICRSFSEDTALSAKVVSLVGAGSNNNVQLAREGTQALVAPFESSDAVKFGAEIEVGALTNHYLDVVNTNHPEAGPVSLNLVDPAGRQYYYPTRVFFDSASGRVFLRATNLSPDSPPAEALCYATLGKDGASFDDSLIGIQIPSVGDASLMPTDFGLSRDGKLVVYTNGASIFVFDPVTGINYPVGPLVEGSYIPLQDYLSDYNSITRLVVDRQTNNVIVTVSSRTTENSVSRYASDIYIYALNEAAGPAFGTVDLVRIISRRELSGGVPPFSDICIGHDNAAYFVLDDGSLCRVGLDQRSVVEVLARIPALAAWPYGPGTPISLTFDDSGKTLGIVKKGFILTIRRPAYGGRGRSQTIRRPAYLHLHEAPVVELASFRNNGQIGNISEFSAAQMGSAQLLGVSNIASFDGNSRAVLATFDGNLISVGSDGVSNLCKVPVLTDSLTYDSGGSMLAGISAFTVDLDRGKITSGGSVAMVGFPSAKAGASGVISSILAAPSVKFARIPGSIRRPCNVVWQ